MIHESKEVPVLGVDLAESVICPEPTVLDDRRWGQVGPSRSERRAAGDPSGHGARSGKFHSTLPTQNPFRTPWLYGFPGITITDTSKGPGRAKSAPSDRKRLVAFFSWSGNTRTIANRIHDDVGGDLFEIVSVDAYPRDYDECVERARQELEKGYRPQLKSEVDDLGLYDVIFIGYPNWWGTIPMPVATFLAKCDSSDKTIVPFCTHGGGRLGRSVADIAKLCSHSKILDALAVSEGSLERAENQVSDWLRRIGIMM